MTNRYPSNPPYPVRRYEELRPDELMAILSERPVAIWPLGLLEHHGWHLPIGFDGIKADRICRRLAMRTGGVLLPVMWWGAIGGHESFLWTHYQDAGATGRILETTARQLLGFGFRAVVLVAGHGPLDGVMNERLPAVRDEFPESLLFWGTESTIAGPELLFPTDHAAYEETSFGLELMPELMDIKGLRPGRRDNSWPGGVYPSRRVADVVCSDPADPLFAQMGVDARRATAAHGRDVLDAVVDHVAKKVNEFLARSEQVLGSRE